MHYNDYSNPHLPVPFYKKPLHHQNTPTHEKSYLNSSKNSCRHSKSKKSMDQQMMKESLECTFEPKIKNSKEKRSIQRFLDDQDRFQVKKQQKIIVLKTQKQKSQEFSLTLVPKIDYKSKRIFDDGIGKREKNIFERLSKQKISKQNDHPQCPFSPNILKKSHELHRTSNISILLYEDAKRRQSKESFLSQSFRNNHTEKHPNPKINLKTNKLVINKTLIELQGMLPQQQLTPLTAILLLEDLFRVDLNPSKSTQNNLAVKKILSFIKTDEQGNGQTIDLYKLRQFVASIICIQESSKIFSKEQQIQIHQQFKHLYTDRLAKEKKVFVPEKLQFKPKTLKKSQILAQTFRQKSCKSIQKFIESQNIKLNLDDGCTVQDLFIINHMKKKIENEQKRLQNEQTILKQCTFTPNTMQSKQSMQKLKENMKQHKIVLKPKNKSSNNLLSNTQNVQVETQKTKNITKFPPKKNKQNVNIKDISMNNDKQTQKVMLRLSIGRQRREFENKLLTRGYPKNENWHELCNRMHRKSIQNEERLKIKAFPNR